MSLLHHPFWLKLVFKHQFSTIFNYFVWLRITDEGSVPEMRIWSILLIQSDLKWCLHLSKSLFLYLFSNLTLLLNLSLKECLRQMEMPTWDAHSSGRLVTSHLEIEFVNIIVTSLLQIYQVSRPCFSSIFWYIFSYFMHRLSCIWLYY